MRIFFMSPASQESVQKRARSKESGGKCELCRRLLKHRWRIITYLSVEWRTLKPSLFLQPFSCF